MRKLEERERERPIRTFEEFVRGISWQTVSLNI